MHTRPGPSRAAILAAFCALVIAAMLVLSWRLAAPSATGFGGPPPRGSVSQSE
jgi:hypothetical protein